MSNVDTEKQKSSVELSVKDGLSVVSGGTVLLSSAMVGASYGFDSLMWLWVLVVSLLFLAFVRVDGDSR